MSVTLRYDWSNREAKTSGTASELSLTDSKSAVALAVTRATTASVSDYNNVLKTVNSGEERYTGGRRVENLFNESQTFDVAPNVKNLVTVDANAATAPDGTLTADRISDDGLTGSSSSVQIFQNRVAGQIPVDTQWTWSVYLKADQTSWVLVSPESFSVSNTSIYFDAATGTFGSAGSGLDAYSVEDAGDGWYRVSVTLTIASDNAGTVRIYLADADNDKTIDRDGTHSVFIWGGQIEDVSGQDDPSPSEYIATTTAAVSKWYATKRRTNLLKNSDDASATGWSNVRSTDTQGLPDPDGGTGAWSLDEDGTSANTHNIRQITAAPVVKAGDDYTFSIKAKASNRDWLNLEINDYAGAPKRANFNLSTGAIGITATDDATMTDLGDGWYLCTATQNMAAGPGSSPGIRINIGESDNDITFDGLTQESLILYEPMWEKGLVATAYVENTTDNNFASSTFDTAIAPTGLLVEEARTNICLQSEDFSTTWTVGGLRSVINVDDTVAPDGTLTADQLIDDNSTGSGISGVAQTITVATTTAYTFSVYVKADQLDWCALNTTAFTTPANGQTYFDLTNGVVGTEAAGHSGSIEYAGNGWYRCSITFTTDAADTSGQVRVYTADADTDHTVDWDGTSSIFLWGAQLEAGVFPTSYIPTVASSVTRNFDDISSATVSWVNTSAGSYYVRSNHPYQTAQSNASLCLGVDGGTSSATQMGSTASNHANWLGRNGPSGIYNITSVNHFLTAAFAEMVIGYAEDDFQTYANGVAGTLDSSGTPPTGQDSLQVGALTNDTQIWNGHISEIVYDNTRLTDAELEDWSNGTNLPVSANITGIRCPRDSLATDEARFHTFITDSGITKTGDLVRDYRAALHSVVGASGAAADYSIQDLFKRYYDSL